MKKHHILSLFLLFFCGALLAAPLTEQEMQELVQKADEYVAVEKYSKAAKVYKRLVAQPSLSNAQLAGWMEKQANCLFLAGKTQKAKETYQELLRKCPLHVNYEVVVPRLRALAERYVNGDGTFWGLRDRDVAVEIYGMILRDAPAIHRSMADRIRMAELQEQLGDWSELIATYQEILRLDPKQHQVRWKYAQLLFRFSEKGDGDGMRLRAAEREARTLLENCPDFPEMAAVNHLLQEVRETRAQRLLDLAKFYLGKAQFRPNAAKMYLQELQEKYPNTRAWEMSKILLPVVGLAPTEK